MGIRSSIAAIALVLLCAAQAGAAPARDEVILKASSPWNLEYAKSMCQLTRDFGEGEAKVTLGFKPGPASDYFRVFVVTRNDSRKVTHGAAQLVFDGQMQVNNYFNAHPITKPLRMVTIDVKRSDLALLGSTKYLTFRADEVNVTLAPTRAAEALRALANCETDLLVSWGMDLAVLQGLAKFPTISQKGWKAAFLSYDDYPFEALKRNEQGTVGARVHVDANGRVTECVVIETSGSISLDRQTCSIINSRFRFEPARDRGGQSVSSFTFERINWQIPN